MADRNVESMVEDLIGPLVDVSEDPVAENVTAVTEWASDIAREVINVLPTEMLWSVGAEIDEPGSGATVTTAKFLHAHKSGYKAIEIDAADKARATDSGSILYATSKSPVYYRENGKVHVKPDGGTVVAVNYPTINHDDATVTGVPDDVKHLVIMGTAVKGRLFQLDALRRSLDLLTAPDYNTENASLVLVPVPSITDLTITADLPDTIVDPIFSDGSVESSDVVFDEDAPVFNKPVFSPPGFPTFNDLDLSSLSGDLPDASSIVIQNYEVGTLPASLPSYIKSTPPTQTYDIVQFETFLETEEDSELADSQMRRLNHEVSVYQADLQKYANEIQEELNEFNKENVEYQAELQKVIMDAQSKQPEDAAKLQKLQAELGRYQALVQNEVTEYQNNELQNKYQRWVTEYTNGLQEYGANIQNESQKFNEANNEYQGKLQIAIRDAEAKSREYLQEGNNKLQSDVQEYSNKLQNHGAALQRYAAEVNSQLQEYGVNEVQKEIGLWQADNTQKLQKYGADLQKETARHGSDMQKYQIDIQNIFQKHQTMTQELQVLDAQYTRGLQTFVASYKEPMQNAKGV